MICDIYFPSHTFVTVYRVISDSIGLSPAPRLVLIGASRH